jgi:hypothetical protein
MASVYQRLQHDATVLIAGPVPPTCAQGDGPSIIDLTQDAEYGVPCLLL